MNTVQHQAELGLAIQVARAAGAKLRDGVTELREVEFLDRTDVKLRADREAEEQIRSGLSARYPYPIYGEEQGGDESLRERYEPYWVVDPLDGTFNYLRGNPSCAVSIGLMRGETPILGVIYDFNTNTCFSGIAGVGFFINDRRVTPKWAATIDQSALITGMPAGMDKSTANVEAFVTRIAPFKKVRMNGSAALALAYVAAGYVDVYYEESIRLWDIAAGLAMVQAAGGVIRMKTAANNKPMAYDVWAGSEPLITSAIS